MASGRNRGGFTSQKEAAEAYDRAARQHFGAFSRTNFRQKRNWMLAIQGEIPVVLAATD